MVIYSPWPAEMLYSDQTREFVEVPFGEATLITEVDAQGVCKIVRLVSSDPADYLNPLLQPGMEIRYRAFL